MVPFAAHTRDFAGSIPDFATMSFGSTKKEHYASAAQAMKFFRSQVKNGKRNLRDSNCIAAYDNVIAASRMVGKLVTEKINAGKGGTIQRSRGTQRAADALENGFFRKCIHGGNK